jgi:pimeloyl-ACP methyl ester carboxylesterase
MDRDVLALLDELELDRVDLVGHDWGGWIGFLLALRWPERIGRSVSLTIVPPWPSGDRRGVLEAWRIAYQIPLALPQLGRRAAEHGLARLALRAGSDAFSEGEIEAFTDRLKGERARGASCFTGPFCCARPCPCLPDATPECPSKVPSLLLVGARDAVTPTRAVREQASGADALELELVPGAGQLIVDEKPELVADRTLGSFRP